MAIERKTSNWVLGIGYLLIAFVILLNYIRQKPEPNPQAGKPAAIEKDHVDIDSLKNQLVEERRVNREMSEMLAKLQSAIRDGGTYVPDQAPRITDKTDINPDEILNDIFRHGFPKLEILAQASSAIPPTNGSFRNPFLPYYDRTRPRSVTVAQGSKPPRLQVDPRIPLPFQNTWNKPVIYESSAYP